MRINSAERINQKKAIEVRNIPPFIDDIHYYKYF